MNGVTCRDCRRGRSAVWGFPSGQRWNRTPSGPPIGAGMAGDGTEEMMACAREELAEYPGWHWYGRRRRSGKAQAESAVRLFRRGGMEPVGDRLERLERVCTVGGPNGDADVERENLLACGAGGDRTRA